MWSKGKGIEVQSFPWLRGLASGELAPGLSPAVSCLSRYSSYLNHCKPMSAFGLPGLIMYEQQDNLV